MLVCAQAFVVRIISITNDLFSVIIIVVFFCVC